MHSLTLLKRGTGTASGSGTAGSGGTGTGGTGTGGTGSSGGGSLAVLVENVNPRSKDAQELNATSEGC